MAKNDDKMRAALDQARRSVNLPLLPWAVWESGYCHAHKDGDCTDSECPQNRDGEPGKTGRHCPIDIHEEERGYQ